MSKTKATNAISDLIEESVGEAILRYEQQRESPGDVSTKRERWRFELASRVLLTLVGDRNPNSWIGTGSEAEEKHRVNAAIAVGATDALLDMLGIDGNDG